MEFLHRSPAPILSHLLHNALPDVFFLGRFGFAVFTYMFAFVFLMFAIFLSYFFHTHKHFITLVDFNSLFDSLGIGIDFIGPAIHPVTMVASVYIHIYPKVTIRLVLLLVIAI